MCRWQGLQVYFGADQLQIKVWVIPIHVLKKDTWGCGHLPGDPAVHDPSGLLVQLQSYPRWGAPCSSSVRSKGWEGRAQSSVYFPGPHGGWLREGPELRSRVSVSLIAAYSKVHSPNFPVSSSLTSTEKHNRLWMKLFPSVTEAYLLNTVITTLMPGLQQSMYVRGHTTKNPVWSNSNSQLGPVEFWNTEKKKKSTSF